MLTQAPPPERLAWLAWPPIAATGFYYALPAPLQHLLMIQFLPQILSYLGLAIWSAKNGHITDRFGLRLHQISEGLTWGLATGLALGTLNVSVILWLVPWLGGDIAFLQDTPHAKVPPALMLPWLILLIAAFVEVNFRGFLLGRLLSLCRGRWFDARQGLGSACAVGTAALAFSFDPFMVVTFKHLHWIAIWDGLVWGALWLRLRNLYAPIVAHAVEVMIMYSIVKAVLA